jgi:GntR family transcriptional regulator/MocR family aminotransferase
MRDQLFHLEPDGKATLQTQLRRMLVSAILAGQIPPGTPLPSCRKLAKTLSVARNTVSLAYQELVEEGFLISRERRGYFVNEDILKGQVGAGGGPRRAAAEPAASGGAAEGTGTGGPATGAPDWTARFRVHPSSQRNIVKPRNWQEFRYPFIYGQYDPELFPIAAWRECTRQAQSLDAIHVWAIDRFTDDDPLLIDQIRTRLLPRRGVLAAPDEILVTVGAQNALYLLASLLVDATKTVGVENPGYADARNIFALKTKRGVALEVDGDGLVVGPALDACDYVYTTPSHQFPTTATLSLERRRALLERAAKADFVIIEDDYESEINHVGMPSPALKSLDHAGRVVFVASLSKTLAPGLRLGYMVGSKELIAEARALRRLMLRHPPANNQRTIALFLARGHHDSLVRRLSHAYRDRWAAMREALQRHLPDCSFRPTSGGTAYWIEGPPALDCGRLEREAAAAGILIEPGAIHFAGPDVPRNFFRLGFSSIPVDRIEPGLRALGEIIRRQLGRR